ncbi:MAG: hypothetical protein R6W78_05530, partial [Bacteroidales bacterium]
KGRITESRYVSLSGQGMGEPTISPSRETGKAARVNQGKAAGGNCNGPPTEIRRNITGQGGIV